MEFGGGKRQRGKRAHIKVELEDLDKKYGHTLSFYQKPPDESISLQELEDYAVARLKLMRTIERVNLTSHVKYSIQWCDEIKKELGKQKLEFFTFPAFVQEGDTPKLLEARKIDHLSHYILRLAYCKTEESRRWLVNMEVDFFRFKYSKESIGGLKTFMEANDMFYKPMDKEKQMEKEMLENLEHSTFQVSPGGLANIAFYEVPFTEVLDLVRSRKVYLRKGIAFVPFNDLGQVLACRLRSHLSQALAITSKFVHRINDDERLFELLTDFDKRHTGRNFGVKKENSDSVTTEMLPELSNRSFPMCMKNLYEVVKKESHLKHWGRLQLGLFFKGIGLPLDEATNFWRTNFMRKAGMDGTRFDKQYLYNIRHMYGQEGKRADYTPHSCMKIIMSSVGPGDHHGCPFRHSDPTPLRTKLADAEISGAGIKEIMDLAEKTHYSIACQKYFEWTHNKATVDGGINHPNQYFEESQKVLNGGVRIKVNDVAVKKTRVNVYSQQKEVIPQDPSSKPTKDWTNEDEDIIMATLDEVEVDESQSQPQIQSQPPEAEVMEEKDKEDMS